MSSLDDRRVFSSLASALTGSGPSTDRAADMFERIQGRISEIPAGGMTTRRDAATWKQVSDTIRLKIMHVDEQSGTQTALWDLKPGAVIPSHRHSVTEECMVLDGRFHIGDHVLEMGDFHVMQAGSRHPELSSPGGCLLYIRQGITRDLGWITEAARNST